MRIVVLDGHAINPGDNPWDPVAALGELEVYDSSPRELVVERARGAEVVVTNKTDRTQDHDLALHLSARQDPEKKGGGFFSGGAANLSSFLCATGDKVERQPIEKLPKDPINKIGANVNWLGADEKFFLLAAVPYPEAPGVQRTCQATSQDGQVGEGTLRFAERSVPAHGSTTYSFAVFAGPKVRDDLEAVRPGGADVQLDNAVDVTLAAHRRDIAREAAGAALFQRRAGGGRAAGGGGTGARRRGVSGPMRYEEPLDILQAATAPAWTAHAARKALV